MWNRRSFCQFFIWMVPSAAFAQSTTFTVYLKNDGVKGMVSVKLGDTYIYGPDGMPAEMEAGEEIPIEVPRPAPKHLDWTHEVGDKKNGGSGDYHEGETLTVISAI
jgi:hypothetical protein